MVLNWNEGHHSFCCERMSKAPEINKVSPKKGWHTFSFKVADGWVTCAHYFVTPKGISKRIYFYARYGEHRAKFLGVAGEWYSVPWTRILGRPFYGQADIDLLANSFYSIWKFPTTPLDYNMNKLYRAEHVFFNTLGPVSKGKQFANIEECRQYVGTLVDNPLIRSGHPKVFVRPVRVLEVTGKWATANYASDTIRLPQWAFTQFTILHEFAHLLTPIRFKTHGQEWIENFVMLIGIEMGQDAAQSFMETMLQQGLIKQYKGAARWQG